MPYSSRVSVGADVGLTKFNVTLSRGLSVDCGSMIFVRLKTASAPFSPGDEFTASVICEGDVDTEQAFFTGIIIEQTITESAYDPNSYEILYRFEDSLCKLEKTPVKVSIGRTPQTVSTILTGLGVGVDVPSSIGNIALTNFYFDGTGFEFVKKVCELSGQHPSGGAGSSVAIPAGANIIKTTLGIPETGGLTSTMTITLPHTTYAHTSFFYSTKSQQWWIPFVVYKDTTAKVLFMSYIRAPCVIAPDSIWQMYFGSTLQIYNTMTQSAFDAAISAGSIDQFSNPTIIFSSVADDIHATLCILKEYNIPDVEDGSDLTAEEVLGAQLLSKFKEELPDIITVHMAAQGNEVLTLTVVKQVGSAPFDEVYLSTGEAVSESFLASELCERKRTNSIVYEGEIGIIGSIPIPSHWPGDNSGDTLESVSVDYSVSSGVQITAEIGKISAIDASFVRMSRRSYFKRARTSSQIKIEMIKGADYAYRSGASLVFVNGATTAMFPITDFIESDNGLLTWRGE